MSPRLPRVSADEAIRALEKIGFVLSRQSGSHKIYKNTSGKRVTIPYHKTKTLHPKILTSILRGRYYRRRLSESVKITDICSFNTRSGILKV